MSKHARPHFSTAPVFVTIRAFRFQGKSYEIGDEFNWRKLACPMRRLRQLYDSKFIDPITEEVVTGDLGDSGTVDKADSSDDQTADLDNETNDLGDEETDEDADEGDDSEDEVTELTFDPDVHEIANPSQGVWVMTQDGEIVAHLTAREGKRLRRKTKPVTVNPEGILEE